VLDRSTQHIHRLKLGGVGCSFACCNPLSTFFLLFRAVGLVFRIPLVVVVPPLCSLSVRLVVAACIIFHVLKNIFVAMHVPQKILLSGGK